MGLGQRIRALRTKKGMTQTQLAGEHITRNMLSQIENGTAVPSMKTLRYLAEKLDVSVGFLLEGQSSGALSQARELLKQKNFSAAIEAALSSEEQGDELQLLLATAYSRLARSQMLAGELASAAESAGQALAYNDASIYGSEDIRARMLGILAHCSVGQENADAAVQEYKNAYRASGWEARYHLLCARYYLQQGQVQAAEREIWTITALPEEERLLYLLLRGWLAVIQEKFTNALAYLQQVEKGNLESRFMRTDLYRLLETAYRELGDYKAAYEYAAKQREL